MNKLFLFTFLLFFVFTFPTFSKEPKTIYLACNGITQENERYGKKRKETKTFILKKNKTYGYLKYYLVSEIGKIEDCRVDEKEISCGEPPRGSLDHYSFYLDRINGSIEEFIIYSKTGPLYGNSNSFKGKCEIKNKKFL